MLLSSLPSLALREACPSSGPCSLPGPSVLTWTGAGLRPGSDLIGAVGRSEEQKAVGRQQGWGLTLSSTRGPGGQVLWEWGGVCGPEAHSGSPSTAGSLKPHPQALGDSLLARLLLLGSCPALACFPSTCPHSQVETIGNPAPLPFTATVNPLWAGPAPPPQSPRTETLA